MFSSEQEDLARRVFFPEEELDIASSVDLRFVHYTTAAAAANILRTREWWLREPSSMNDTHEVLHGLQCAELSLQRSRSEFGLYEALESIAEDLPSQISQFLSHPILHPQNIYIGCLSEHLQREDQHGRLSMWRAYGGDGGVAFILNRRPVLENQGVLTLSTHKVRYHDTEDIQRSLKQMAGRIAGNEKELRQIEKGDLRNILVSKLREIALSCKHPGFAEEREWRLLYDSNIRSSPYIIKQVETLKGIPQTICKVPLRTMDDGTVTGAEIPGLIERVIIGPTKYPKILEKAFVQLLKDADVANAAEKVVVSGIPLRL